MNSPDQTAGCLCPHCGATVEYLLRDVGEIANCRHCHGVLQLPAQTAAIEQQAEYSAVEALRREWPQLALICGVVAFFVSQGIENYTRDGRTPIAYSYLAIVPIAAGASYFASRRFGLWRPFWVAVASTVVLWIIWGRFDTYDTSWEKASDHRKTTFVDTYQRWSRRIVHRRMTTYVPEDGKVDEWRLLLTMEGPMAGTGKPHGEWKWFSYSPDWDMGTDFYWYGEEISEGEWHLRNR